MEYNIEGYEIGRKIGAGGFCHVLLGRRNDGSIAAIKVEPETAAKKTLNWDVRVLKKVAGNPLFPKYIDSGSGEGFTWLAMERLGPSLEDVIQQLPEHKLSRRCALIVARHLLNACEATHEAGFIHRDLKPGNILLRKSREFPLTLSDFGLSKIYFDEGAHMHLPAKPHSGFPGTFLYASPNAHMRRDLSRRDDMFSWFYVMVDLLTGSLPWKDMKTSQEILNAKAHMDYQKLGEVEEMLPTIWTMIAKLSYVAKPDYAKIGGMIDEAIAKHEGEPDFDWHPSIFNVDEPENTEFP